MNTTRTLALAALLALCLSLAACENAGPDTAANTTAADTSAADTTAADTSAADTTSADATAAETSNEAGTPPVLARIGGSFTGTTPLVTENDFHGGYFYSEQTEDGHTVILNCCFSSTWQGEPLEDYIARCAGELSQADIQNFSAVKNEEHTQRICYPVHLLSWQTGSGEDARQWDAFFFMTDTHTYFYAFDTAADAASDMREVWLEVFGQLELL